MNDEIRGAMGNVTKLEGAEAIKALESFQVAYTRATGETHEQAAQMLASMRAKLEKEE